MITQAELKEILDYDPETGIFRWKVSRNGIKIGSIAGNKSRCGPSIQIKGKKYLVRRLAWVYVYGVDPESCLVSPLDKDIYNNKIRNLRLITIKELNIEKSKNMKQFIINKSGVTGVCWSKKEGRWRASITVLRNYKSLGYFDNLTAAKKARQEAMIKYGFPETHGEERCPF